MKDLKTKDGIVKLRIEEAALTAYLSLYPSGGRGKPVSVESVLGLLASEQVSFGIRIEAIREAVERCEREHAPVTDIPVAAGIPPVNLKPPYFRLKDTVLTPRALPPSKDGNIDYRLISPFLIVSEGELLAERIPGTDGVPGTALNGDSIPFESEEPPLLEPGKNTQESPEGITALCAGRLIVEGNHFWVNETLTIKGDVDYHTGNITYPGDVEISGIVREGFVLTVGGSLNLLSTVDATKILCNGNLSSAGGLIGHGEGLIMVRGEVKARFLQNCHLEALKSVRILKSVAHSTVYCQENIFLGKNGTILNSRISALGDVTTWRIGTEGSQDSVIHCGIDYLAQRRVEQYRDALLKVNELLNRISTLEQKSGDSALKIQKAKLEEEMQELIGKVSEALNSLDVNDNAQVVVTGTVYPGTVIKICSLTYLVKEKMDRVTFSIDKKIGRITVRRVRQEGST